MFKSVLKRATGLVTVVIPVYKSEMNETEEVSFRQCLSVLGQYPIHIIAPEGLSLERYTALHPAIRVIRYPARFFQGISGYNELTLSAWFYRDFLHYQYMLIYQLDAYVFRDELREWCRRGYSYIGAPWILEDWPYLREVLSWLPPAMQWAYHRRLKTPNMVGNGGFSLRRVQTFYLSCTLFRDELKRWKQYALQEDMFWSFFMPFLAPWYRTPAFTEAARFAFELSPEKLYQINGEKLPFGCHAWEKYNYPFWQQFIQSAV